MPNGKFFYAGVGQMWGPFGQPVDEAMTAFFQFFDPKTKKWSSSRAWRRSAPEVERSWCRCTMKPPYEKMTAGHLGRRARPAAGSWLPANPLTTLTTIDANGNVTNRNGGNLNHARWYSSGVLLPDGQVLAVGGADKDDVVDPGHDASPVKIPELYDPSTGQVDARSPPHARDRALPQLGAAAARHAGAARRQRPLAAHYGGPNRDQGRPFANNDNDPSFEIWSPPYLFRGPRPSVKRVQKAVNYGETFTITTPDAGLIESVLLLRTPSPATRRTTPTSGRSSSSSPAAAPSTLTATAPPSGNVAPPGTYYLVVNKRSLQGPIPSVARMVDVGRTDLSDALQPFPDDAPAPAGGSATPDEDTSNAAQAQLQAAERPRACRRRR